jgi:pSer/pThr/pTyr-binding forkhead associated (FHA) protein
MTNVPRTITVPEEERPPALEGPDLVTGVREYGRPLEHPLLVKQATFTIGSSPSCDVPIASEYVSSLHCVLERRGQRLRVHDQTSRNGTFFRGRRESTFDIVPGDMFMLATTAVLALNDHMRLARPVLAQVLGYDHHAVVDDVLMASVEEGPLLVVGPKGAGQLRLVRAIHEISLRRCSGLVEVARLPATSEEQKQLLAKARRGALAVTVNGSPLDEMFLDLVLSSDSHVRLVVLAPSLEAAMQSVRIETMTRMSKVEIRALRARRAELGVLVDRLLVENRLSLRVTDLTRENQRALEAYPWPENLDELRETVTWMAAIVREGSIRKAAPLLGVPRSTLQYWMERIDLTLPLTRSGSSGETDRGGSPIGL